MKDMNALITRINELYHKSKTKEGLTEEEKPVSVAISGGSWMLSML